MNNIKVITTKKGIQKTIKTLPHDSKSIIPAITDISNFYAPNVMIVENFIELTTLKSWIFIDPNTTYNPLTNLLAKLYG